MSARPTDDPLARLQRAIDAASSSHTSPAHALVASRGDALADVRALIARAQRERDWPPPLSGILSSLYRALDLDASTPEDATTPRLVDQLGGATNPPAPPAALNPPAQTTPPPAPAPPVAAARAQAGAPDRTAELLLAAIGSRPLDGPSRAIVARLLTEASAEDDWASVRRALEIVVTGG
jgi:hypothetical protein